MITSLTLKNVATFDGKWVFIDDLKQINFIYGANGSGKTTISNFLFDRSRADFSQCSLNWKPGHAMSVLAFNKEFKERNFGNGKIEGIFTLGEASKDAMDLIDKKRENLQEIRIRGEQRRVMIESEIAKRDSLEIHFKDKLWERIYKKYGAFWKEAFTGFLTKEKFKDKILLEAGKVATANFSENELKEKAKTIFAKEPNKIQKIDICKYDRLAQIESNSIWERVIEGKTNVNISELIHRLHLSDWVNQGRTYIQEAADTCPFCQQDTLSPDFRNQLAEFFDETYTREVRAVLSLTNEYHALTKDIFSQLHAIESAQRLLPETKLDIERYAAILRTLVSQSAVNCERVSNKLKEPSRSFQLIRLHEQLDPLILLIKNANVYIDQHNYLMDHFKAEKVNLIQNIWLFLVAEFKTLIDEFKYENLVRSNTISSLEIQQIDSRNSCVSLDNEIKNLSKNVTSVQPSIDEINRMLKSQGFINFKIVPSGDAGYYQIRRGDGSMAESTLSEGEIAFVTFLYFVQLCKGALSPESFNEHRVLVIDDPVSGLDNDILRAVSALIGEIITDIKGGIGNIKQLIVLTHNVFFYKEVSCVDTRNAPCSETHFWVLKKNGYITSIEPFLKKNPMLQQPA
jgi:wobble nucleotide-excising tRNase